MIQMATIKCHILKTELLQYDRVWDLLMIDLACANLIHFLTWMLWWMSHSFTFMMDECGLNVRWMFDEYCDECNIHLNEFQWMSHSCGATNGWMSMNVYRWAYSKILKP